LGRILKRCEKKNLRAGWRDRYMGKKGAQDRSAIKGASNAAVGRLENREKHTRTRKRKKQKKPKRHSTNIHKETNGVESKQEKKRSLF
jgi:hypothetical protein